MGEPERCLLAESLHSLKRSVAKTMRGRPELWWRGTHLRRKERGECGARGANISGYSPDVLKTVSCRHQVVVVDDLDKRLNLGRLCNLGLAHVTGDLRWISLDTGYKSMWEWMCF